MVSQTPTEYGLRPNTLTIPELEQSKAAVLNTLASVHSRRSYTFAIDRFIAWYCSEPRLTFNRAVVVRYRSHLEGLSLSASTINSHLSAIRKLADESAESGWLTPELAIGIRRVQGVKRLGRKIGNWLSRSQAQELVNAASKTNPRGWRDGAIVGLLLGCGLRRSEVVGLTLEQLQLREGRWVIVDLIGKGRRLRTVPVPAWSKQLLDEWLSHSGVSEGRVFRRVSKVGKRQEASVTANVLYHSLAGFPPPTAFFWGGHLSEMPTSRQHGFVRHYDLVRDARNEALPVIVPFRRRPARPSAVQLHHRPSVLPLGSP